MKRLIRPAALCLAAILFLFNITITRAETAPPKSVDIMFFHDTHSHLDSFSTIIDEDAVTVGGFARIKTLINEQMAENPDTLLVDAGDFSMGTLVQAIFSSESAELRMLGSLGCEATTLGNHEFDYRSKGLAGALDAAGSSGEAVPAMVLCNIDWETMEAEGLTADQQLLKDALDRYGAKDYIMVEKGGIKIAILGVFGADALACAPTCVLKFKDISEAAAETVREIQEKEDADMIICLSHSGTNADESKSEDEILAKSVPEIDLIISGHTHTTLEEPIRHGDTYIVSAGEYGKNLGFLTMRQTESGRWSIDVASDYGLTPITDDIAPDLATQEKIDSLMDLVDSVYLSQFGYTNDQVLAQNEVVFCPQEDLGDTHTDQNLGNFMSDAYVYTVENAADYDGHPVDVAIVPNGCVRDTYPTGDITVTDVFNSFSLGIGPDEIPGYPVISVYLTGKELKTVAEIDASISDLMTAARLYTFGLEFSYNPNRLILNKVTDCYLRDHDGNRVEIEDDKLYRVVGDLYSGQMLGAVTKVSYGLLTVTPKFADGTPIENIEDAIVTENGRELKAWTVFARYMESLEDTDGDGIANIPRVYATAQGRKIVEDSHSLKDLLKQPNKYAFMIVGVILAVLAIIILLIVLICKLIRKILRNTKSKSRS
ncbi:MAG: bifunctional metallophosphatase/5'-nucleotidase [Lachnospiraceae bacterium]|nr:bifunctional metallophosphatase/5'-nucleotidase [Lachnospiraceae bacterium]MCM1238974.1 bifunctional metallophosphatase/5'-nucleotidase [Lachnospiraceae bacterium]